MTIATVTATDLLNAARAAGIVIDDGEGHDTSPHLYIWTTTEDEVLYIGKAASTARTRDEERWTKDFDSHMISVGFLSLINRHQGIKKTFAFKTVDGRVLEQALDGWHGASVDNLRAALHREWEPREIESVLIRMAVLAGVPIANSSSAGQWESYNGRIENTLAAVAVINSDALRVPSLEEAIADAPDAQITAPSS